MRRAERREEEEDDDPLLWGSLEGRRGFHPSRSPIPFPMRRWSSAPAPASSRGGGGPVSGVAAKEEGVWCCC